MQCGRNFNDKTRSFLFFIPRRNFTKMHRALMLRPAMRPLAAISFFSGHPGAGGAGEATEAGGRAMRGTVRPSICSLPSPSSVSCRPPQMTLGGAPKTPQANRQNSGKFTPLFIGTASDVHCLVEFRFQRLGLVSPTTESILQEAPSSSLSIIYSASLYSGPLKQ